MISKPKDTARKIQELRTKLGSSLAIVGHHYQADEVIRHTDMRGDSLELARKVGQITSGHIVFCGVFFMAESAALLARQGQKIYLPDLQATCSMAEMAAADDVRTVLRHLTAGGRKVVPLAYVNSSLAVKDVVGEYGGAVCTSSNARVMLEWARSQADAVLFLPDKCLGANTAKQLGIPRDRQLLLDVRGQGAQLDLTAANQAELLLWPGYCCIHTYFTCGMVAEARNDFPGCRVIVHPESSPEVVDASDAAGSTSFLIKYVNEAPDGSHVVVGTEINLVKRLAKEHHGRVVVTPLAVSACPDMGLITEERLLAALEDIDSGSGKTYVEAPDALRENARASLERMLAACS